MKVLLFDIDGVLLERADPVHRASYSYAFKKVWGIEAAADEIVTSGKTDLVILKEVMEKHGVSESEIEKNMDRGISSMAEYVRQNIEDLKERILPHVVETLEFFKEKSFLMGVATGNIEEIAWTKMEKSGLRDFFSFGGFGTDDGTKEGAVRAAVERARQHVGSNVPLDNFYLLDDAVLGVQAGKQAGVKTIGVATGRYSMDELKAMEPDLVIKDLSAKEKIIKL